MLRMRCRGTAKFQCDQGTRHFVVVHTQLRGDVAVVTLAHLQLQTPERTDLVLASDVSNGTARILVLHSLNVDTDCWNCGNCFTDLSMGLVVLQAASIPTIKNSQSMKRCRR